jgi:hypothetical protein
MSHIKNMTEVSEQIFFKGTKFLLNDGRVKNVEDLLPDDEIMGHDGSGRPIHKIVCKEKTIRSSVVINSYQYDRNHLFFDRKNKLVLSSDSETIINLISFLKDDLKSVEVYDYFVLISEDDYQLLPKSLKQNLYCIRSMFTSKLHTTDTIIRINPTILGYWIGSGKPEKLTPKSNKIKLEFEMFGKYHFAREWGEDLTYFPNDRFFEDIDYYGLKYNTSLLIPYDYKFSGYPVRSAFFSGLVQGLADKYGSCSENVLYWPFDDNMLDVFIFFARSLGHDVSVRTEKRYFGYSVNKFLTIILNDEYYRNSYFCYSSEFLEKQERKIFPNLYDLNISYDNNVSKAYKIELLEPDNLNAVLLEDLTIVKI